MRRIVQLALCVFAVVAMAVTAAAFYEIVLVPAVHGAPVRVVDAKAGPYPVRLALYQDPVTAGADVPFAIAVAPGTRGPLTYQVTARPGPGVPGFPYSVAQGDVDAHARTPDGVPGSITLVTAGTWTLHIVIDGPAGRGEATVPLTAVTFPAMPAWLAWNLGLLPLYGLVAFWAVQVRGVRRRRAGTAA